MSANPYLITGPALISFSGGRTSGYMLYRILEAHGGALPKGVHVAFANTGKERPETLDFVQACSERWDVPIAWVEYDWDGPHRTRIVDYAGASRMGQPFEALIDRKGFLPNPVVRYCTSFLKRDRLDSYARYWCGWKSWASVIGYRYDEARRVHRTRVCGRPRTGRHPVYPLYDDRVTKPAILAWWSDQPFDLQIQDHEGNCDLCHLKARWKIERIIRDRPDLATWWAEQEAKTKRAYRPEEGHSESYTRFRIDRPTYAELVEQTSRQAEFEFEKEVDWDGDDCVCTE